MTSSLKMHICVFSLYDVPFDAAGGHRLSKVLSTFAYIPSRLGQRMHTPRKTVDSLELLPPPPPEKSTNAHLFIVEI